jgi:hypothetical protein
LLGIECGVGKVRTSLTVITLLLLMHTLLVGDSRGDEPTGPHTAHRLVSQLGHEQFAIRERASLKLIALGIDGTNALAAGRESPNREIRHRSTKLYSLIAETDVQRRLEAFENSEDPSQGYGLPGWERFRDEVGTDANSRALFRSMQEDEMELMGLLRNESRLNEEFAVRCDALQKTLQFGPPSTKTSTVASFLFLATDNRVVVTPAIRRTVYTNCLDRDFISKITEGASREPLGKLVSAWMARDSENVVSNVLYLGLITGMETCMPYAKAVLNDPQSDADSRQYALLCFAKFGREADLPLVEKMLDDATPCPQPGIANIVVVTQVRDIALAALVEITKQKHEEYGFDRLQRQDQLVFHQVTLGFTTEARRNAALAAWREYRERSNP